eukprot:5693685-Amphidinium_carterae.1
MGWSRWQSDSGNATEMWLGANRRIALVTSHVCTGIGTSSDCRCELPASTEGLLFHLPNQQANPPVLLHVTTSEKTKWLDS